jgi:hypothetical protein
METEKLRHVEKVVLNEKANELWFYFGTNELRRLRLQGRPIDDVRVVARVAAGVFLAILLANALL